VSTFVLIPGAGGAAWYWHRVAPLLDNAIAVDLPADDESAGLTEYGDLVVEAANGATDVVLVAQSRGAFTALPACARLPVSRLVLLNAMIPQPGETAGAWWKNTGSEDARLAAARAGGWTEEIDLDVYFLHDVDPEVAASGEKHQRNEADIAFEQPCEFEVWPETTVLAGRDDRLFPLDFQRRIARERLGLDVVEVPGGHLAALSHPEEVARAIA
jgi:pimeloyl-ACP methyl ester carboxylesterase